MTKQIGLNLILESDRKPLTHASERLAGLEHSHLVVCATVLLPNLSKSLSLKSRLIIVGLSH